MSRVLAAMVRAWNTLVQTYSQRLNGVLPKDGSEAMTNPLPLEILTVATLPTASLWTGAIVYASDTGAVYYSNGSIWNKLDVGVTGLTAIPNLDIIANISGSSAIPVGNTLTATIDAAIGSTRGSLLERGASGWSLLPPGTSGNFLMSNGAGADPSYTAITSAVFTNVVALTSGTTWTPPAGVTIAWVELQGGGGGGGSFNATTVGGSGGASGGMPGAQVTGMVSVTPGVGVTIAIGGAGAAGTSGGNGGTGGDTTFGGLTAKGGSGGNGISTGSASQFGGQPSVAQYTAVTPTTSIQALSYSYLNPPVTSGSVPHGGVGGPSPNGVGGAAGNNSAGSAPASGYGGGGGGAGHSTGAISSFNGGLGAQGCIIVRY